MRKVALCIALLAVAGCFARPDAPPMPSVDPSTAAGTAPSAILASVTAWAAGLAAFALVGAIVIAWLGKLKTAATIAGIAVSVLVAAPILLFVADHLNTLAIVAVVAGALFGAWLGWQNIWWLEKYIVRKDLDGSGGIGDRPTLEFEHA